MTIHKPFGCFKCHQFNKELLKKKPSVISKRILNKGKQWSAGNGATQLKLIMRLTERSIFWHIYADRFILRRDDFAGIFRHRFVGGDTQHPSPRHERPCCASIGQKNRLRHPRQNLIHSTWYPRRLFCFFQTKGTWSRCLLASIHH